MTAGLRFRKVEPADLPRLHQIRIAAFTPVHDGFREQIGEEMFQIHYGDWQEKQGAHLDEACALASCHQVYVALKDNNVVGFVSISLDEARKSGELGLNAVDPSQQRAGIWTAMYKFALTKLKEAGAKMVLVGTGGDAAHLPARTAYSRAGFITSIPSIYYFKLL